jgi:crossover junction endodeoxyribonuclease RuvC
MKGASDRSVRDGVGGRKVLGIDPGSLVTGWGVVEAVGGSLIMWRVASSQPRALAAGIRLSRIYREFSKSSCVINRPRLPRKVFFAHNARSALKLTGARRRPISGRKWADVIVQLKRIKSAVVGYGMRPKRCKMVGRYSGLKAAADAADALAARFVTARQSFQSGSRSRVDGVLHCAGANRLRHWLLTSSRRGYPIGDSR